MTTRSKARPKPPRRDTVPVTEADVMKQCVEVAAMLGIELRRQNVGLAINPRGQAVRFGQPGDLDLTGTLPGGDGRRIEIECKRPGKKPTPAQWDRIEQVNRDGGVAVWTDDALWLHRVLGLVLAGAAVSWPDRDDLCLIDPNMSFRPRTMTPTKESPP